MTRRAFSSKSNSAAEAIACKGGSLVLMVLVVVNQDFLNIFSIYFAWEYFSCEDKPFTCPHAKGEVLAIPER